ncbi:a76876c6-9bdd-4910-9a3d-348ddf6af8f5 [Sclerotinia trifoliorum]|uniref:A76876c6-9bdd-4910-9a3d-348ddf6af8f5 n=1 Tax=Sclerotinia trifoliorum TaxID=28548 RepID=A0A8H2VML2_9HELO|nr:a76876c6-9bdd-4910-9a3d-348ddf6af8f5 [Sclerotinia trifoliorum]
MKYEIAILFITILNMVSAAPVAEPKNKFNLPTTPKRMLRGREVPQEHSHNRFLDGVRVNLNINNPNNIQDPVFGLLGNAAAIKGAGSITNPDCLHQATADQAFTNAKAANNITGMADALMYAALERNTGSVGLASVICNETAVNSEIQAVQQHQDPAAPNAAATNKAIVLSLAKQLASIGADPQEALLSGTFAPGTIGDSTGAGNSCDTEDDSPGCIFTQNLLVDDATADEITAAVAGTSKNSTLTATTSSSSSDSTSDATGDGCAAAVTSTITASSAVATDSSASSRTNITATGTNVQAFTGTLGGTPPPVISSAGDRPFSVNGDTFVGEGAALQRSCSVQHNACAKAVNSGELAGGEEQCETQETACNAASGATKMLRRQAGIL